MDLSRWRESNLKKVDKFQGLQQACNLSTAEWLLLVSQEGLRFVGLLIASSDSDLKKEILCFNPGRLASKRNWEKS